VSHQPIGIFDSGLGGLTVFREISSLLPHENLVYLGDTARVPYGTKSPQTVVRYARQIARFLLQRNVKMLVVACNTASAFALEDLQKECSIPVLGVIHPGVTGALRSTKTGRIGVIGTEGTIASEAYRRNLVAPHSSVTVFQAACPLFVPLVEEGWWDHEVTEHVATTYLKNLLAEHIDTLILGCTHYPLLKKTLSKVAGPGVSLIDSAEETAMAVRDILDVKGLRTRERTEAGKEYYVTDASERFRRLGELFLGRKIDHVQHIEI
jgi:glutamate racemase